jgi:hypothetical protein
MQQEPYKHCLQLCIGLLGHRLDHDEYESDVVSYLAAIGLEHIHGSDASQYRSRDSGQHTPISSGFIKVAQVLALRCCPEQGEDREVESW